MNRTSRVQKTQALQAALSGSVQALRAYQRQNLKPLLITVQKKPDNFYALKYAEVTNHIMNAFEYERFTKGLERKYNPIIYIIRPN